MKRNFIPIRMCVVCRGRFNQCDLFRYHVLDSLLFIGKGNTKSFYICKECLQKDDKILRKSLGRDKKIDSGFLSALQSGQKLKEILLNGSQNFRDSK
ncbi:MAG: hypothetical protein ACTTJC_04150 [Campylobacter sp.]